MTTVGRHRMTRGRVPSRPIGSAALVALAATILVIAAATTAGAQEAGEEVYRATCAACHRPDGTGVPGTFPPLAGNPRVDDAAYVRSVVREGLTGPLEVAGVTYDGVMPAQPQLSDADVEAVVAYLQAGLPGAGAEPGAAGDSVLGRELFLGSAAFTHDGPACSACHSAGSAGDFSALPATLGPDLTGTAMSPAELSTAVQGHETRMAAASYFTHGLTPDEVAAVAAFLEATAAEDRSSLGDAVVLTAGGILILLLTGTSLVAADRRDRAAERTTR